MGQTDDIGGRSGVFPRIDVHAPTPAGADAPGPERYPAPSDADVLTGEHPVISEDADQPRDDSDSDPTADAPQEPVTDYART